MKRILLISLLLLAVIFTVSADRRRMLMTRNVASAAYSPSDTANLFAWYKSDALVTNTSGASPAAGGDSVASWGDSSGNSRHLRTNSAAIAAPLYIAPATTGKTYGGIEKGAGANLRVGFTAQVDTTIFAVWRNATAGNQKVVVDSTNASNRQIMYKKTTEFIATYAGSEILANGVAIANPSWNIVAATFNSAGNDSLYTNGVAFTTTGTVGATTLDGLSILSRYDNGGDSLGSGEYLGEVIIYSRVLNSTEIGQVNTHLNSRWSVY